MKKKKVEQAVLAYMQASKGPAFSDLYRTLTDQGILSGHREDRMLLAEAVRKLSVAGSFCPLPGTRNKENP